MRFLAACLIAASLAVVPFVAPVLAKPIDHAAMSHMTGNMPCCPDDGGMPSNGCKDCPNMVLCMLKTLQSAIPVSEQVTLTVRLLSRLTPPSETSADGLSSPPLAKPPRQLFSA